MVDDSHLHPINSSHLQRDPFMLWIHFWSVCFLLEIRAKDAETIWHQIQGC